MTLSKYYTPSEHMAVDKVKVLFKGRIFSNNISGAFLSRSSFFCRALCVQLLWIHYCHTC